MERKIQIELTQKQIDAIRYEVQRILDNLQVKPDYRELLESVVSELRPVPVKAIMDVITDLEAAYYTTPLLAFRERRRLRKEIEKLEKKLGI